MPSRDSSALYGMRTHAGGVAGCAFALVRAGAAAFSFHRIVAGDGSAAWAHTSPVSRDGQAAHALLEREPVSRDGRAVFVSGPAVETVADTLAVSVGGESAEAESASIRFDLDSAFNSVELELADYADWSRCLPGVGLSVEVNGSRFGFVVDSRSRPASFGKQTLKVSGRSLTSRMGSPYATPLSKTWEATTARTAALELCEASGIGLDWRLPDWPIPAGALAAENEAPVDVVRKLAAAAGGVLQTSDDGETLVVQSEYPVSPTRFARSTPALTLTDMEDVDTISSEYDQRPGYNQVLVLDKSYFAEPDFSIEELEEGSGAGARILAVYSYPFTEITLNTSGDPESVSVVDLGTFEEDLEELVEISQGVGSVSHFAQELLSWDYRYQDLGDVALERTGLSAATPGQSLVLVGYRTRFQKFAVTSDRLEKVQFWGEL